MYQEQERCGCYILPARVRRNRARRLDHARFILEQDGNWFHRIIAIFFM